jgi:hypothetical protein
MLAANSQLMFQPFVFSDHPRDTQHLQPFAGNATPTPRETVIWKSRIRRRRHPLRVPGARRIRTRPHCTHARHRRLSADLHHDSSTTDPSRTEWWMMTEQPLLYLSCTSSRTEILGGSLRVGGTTVLVKRVSHIYCFPRTRGAKLCVYLKTTTGNVNTKWRSPNKQCVILCAVDRASRYSLCK